jgi:recombinational DNA repair protein (RecF pathway)
LENYYAELDNDQYIILKMLKDFSIFNGINIEVNKCVICGSTHLKTISFADHGMLCNICFTDKKATYFSVEISKGIHYLFNNNPKLKEYVAHFGFVIKLIKQYINDNLGISFNSLKNY